MSLPHSPHAKQAQIPPGTTPDAPGTTSLNHTPFPPRPPGTIAFDLAISAVIDHLMVIEDHQLAIEDHQLAIAAHLQVMDGTFLP